MKNALTNHLLEKSRLNAAEISRLHSFSLAQKLSRNSYILQEGEICKYKIFVAKGLLRTFVTTQDGNEHILRFSPENTWTVDKISYDLQQPATSNINAIETSDLLLWKKADFDALIEELPALKEYTDQLTFLNLYSSSQRLQATLTATAEEKYKQFTQEFPALSLRLPLKMVASFLGISPRTLDRVRHNILMGS